MPKRQCAATLTKSAIKMKSYILKGICASLFAAAAASASEASLQIGDGDVVESNTYAAGKIADGSSVELDGAAVEITGGSHANAAGVSDNRLGVLGGGDLLGSGTETTSLTYTGAVNMTMTGGNMTSLWGGSILGGKGQFSAQKGVFIDVSGGVLDFSVMGGSMSGGDGGQSPGQKADGSTSSISGGAHVSVSGGAQIGASRNSITNMLSNGLYAGSVYGGGIIANSSSESVDYTDVSVGGNAVVNGFVFGGGTSFANGSSEITGAAGQKYSSKVTISGNANIAGGYVFGGMSSAYNQATTYSRITGDTLVSIQGGSIEGADGSGHVFGGSFVTGSWDAGKQANSLIAGNTNVEVSGGGNAAADIYGGGYAWQTDDPTSGGAAMTITGDSNVKISGGTVGNVYGGSLVEGGGGQIMSGVTEGNANITVSGGTVAGGIYGGGRLVGADENTSSTVKGGSTVTLLGNAVVNGGISGSGEGGATVEGAKTLNFGNSSGGFAGTVGGSVGDFDKINIYSGSNVKLSGLNASNDAKMQINMANTAGNSATLEIDGAKYNGLTGSWGASGFSGAVNLTAATSATLKNSEYKNNVISGDGGAFVGGSGTSTINLFDSEVSGNSLVSTKTSSNNTQGVQGGFVRGVSVHIDNVTFSGNSTKSVSEVENSGISNYSGMLQGTDVVVKNSRFAGNTSEVSFNGTASAFVYGVVSSVRGGATAMFENTVFDSNSAKSDYRVQGGTLQVFSGGILNVLGSSFANNSAEAVNKARGAAVENYAANFSAQDTVFSGNNTNSGYGSYGGALYSSNAGAVSDLTDVSFADNSARGNGYGGAVHIEENSIANFNVNKDAVFSGNYAESSSGVKDDSRGGFLYTNVKTQANFNVASGAALTIGNGTAGYDSIASADSSDTITKLGAGALVVNSSMEYYTGALNVNAGTMTANNGLGASSITIASGATLGLRIGGQNTLSNGSLAFENRGALILTAKSGLASGDYSVAAKDGIDFGDAKTYGGDLNGNIFTVVAKNAKSSELSKTAPVTLDGAQILTIVDDTAAGASSVSIASSNAAEGANILVNSAESIAAEELENVLSAWSFDISGVDENNTVVLSFYIGAGYDLAGLKVHHRGESGEWRDITGESGLLSYQDGYLEFLASGFSDYAVTVVPEPAAIAALMGALALAFAAWRRRR